MGGSRVTFVLGVFFVVEDCKAGSSRRRRQTTMLEVITIGDGSNSSGGYTNGELHSNREYRQVVKANCFLTLLSLCNKNVEWLFILDTNVPFNLRLIIILTQLLSICKAPFWDWSSFW